MINSSQIHGWMFDAHQSNVLLGFNLTDQGSVEPIILNLPDLLAQNLAQFQSANKYPRELESESALIAESQILSHHEASDGEISLDQDSNQDQKSEINQDRHCALEIWKHFEDMHDPRADVNQRHKLMDIITIAILGVICGADNWGQIEEFGVGKCEWLSTFLELPFGISLHSRVETEKSFISCRLGTPVVGRVATRFDLFAQE